MNSATSASQRICALLLVAYIVYLSETLVKDVKNLFFQGIQFHPLGVSRIYCNGFYIIFVI